MALTHEAIRSIFSSGGAASSNSPLSAIRTTARTTERLTDEQNYFNQAILKQLRQSNKLLKSIQMSTQGSAFGSGIAGAAGGFGAKIGGKVLGGLGKLGKLGGKALGKIGGKAIGKAGMVAAAVGTIGMAVDNLTGGIFKSSLTQAVTAISKVGRPLEAATMKGGFMTKIGNGLIKNASKAIGVLKGATGGMFDLLSNTTALTKIGGASGLGSMAKAGAKGVGRLLGKLALPVTALFAVVDGISGWNNADSILGRKADLVGKASAAIGSALDGATLGITGYISNMFGYENTSKLLDAYYSTTIGFVKKGVSGLATGAHSLGKAAIGKVQNGFDYIVKNLPDVANLAKDLGFKLWEGITGLFTGISDKVTGGAKDAWTSMFGGSSMEEAAKSANANAPLSALSDSAVSAMASLGRVSDSNLGNKDDGSDPSGNPWLLTKDGSVFWVNQIAKAIKESGDAQSETQKALEAKSKQFLNNGTEERSSMLSQAYSNYINRVASNGGLPSSDAASGYAGSGSGMGASGPANYDSRNPIADMAKKATYGAPYGEYGGKQKPVDHAYADATNRISVSSTEFGAFKEGVASIENAYYGQMGGSSNRFAGRYQMGSAAIGDAAKRLGRAAPSTQEYLANPKMQEEFFEAHTLNNHDYLMKNNRKYQQMNPKQRLAVLGYAHNQGMGGASKWLNTGVSGRDAFGTDGTKYSQEITSRLGSLSEESKNAMAQGATPSMASEGYHDNVFMDNKNATRNQDIDAALKAKMGQAAVMAYGPGSTVEVYSGGQDYLGKGSRRVNGSSTRHDGGFAADAKVRGPDGKIITGDGLAPMLQTFKALGGGGIGGGMQGGSATHFDAHNKRAPYWGYAGKSNGGIGLTKVQIAAMEAGMRGEFSPNNAMTAEQFDAWKKSNEQASQATVALVNPKLQDSPMFKKGLEEREAKATFNARFGDTYRPTVAGYSAMAGMNGPQPVHNSPSDPSFLSQGSVMPAPAAAPTPTPVAKANTNEEAGNQIDKITMFDTELGLLALNTSRFS